MMCNGVTHIRNIFLVQDMPGNIEEVERSAANIFSGDNESEAGAMLAMIVTRKRDSASMIIEAISMSRR